LVFTSGGSEADCLAILGAARAARSRGRHVVTAATEHHAVLHAFEALRDEGFEVTVLPVDADGRIDPLAYEAALRPDTTLVSLMLANNELGTLHPIAALARVARRRGILFHTDAVQAPGRVALDVAALDVDLLSLSAHKLYGPKGVGLLYVRSGTPVAPLVVGGGQEAGLRAGTENVAGIVGFARALELAVAELPVEAPRVQRLRDRFESAILASIPDARANGAGAPRLPSVSSIAFGGIEAATLLVRLDLEGVALSAGSACAAGATTPSHVLEAIGAPAWAAEGTLRFSFGKLTSETDVERLVALLPRVVSQVRGVDVGTSASGSRSLQPEVRS
ncbi:MAG: cysteine desulfurase, partial [Candidatus Eremiobacteraeota bacterium]|nr:cysteine desulfurase [Candidatus Eremiobacteraeota bacterium]